MSTVLPPINPDGSSVVKHGSTVPVKVRITDCSGAPVAGLAPTVSWSPSDGIGGSAASTAAYGSGTMRYDPAAGQYIYNLSTKSLPNTPARYTLTVHEPQAPSLSTSATFWLRTK
jgi:hypothetical protein